MEVDKIETMIGYFFTDKLIIKTNTMINAF